ncbi:MAG: GTP-binding protein [bacterium]
MNYSDKKIRNVAIIAHVDHGKTTLVDAFMKQNHVFRENQDEMKQEMILDSGTLEREKGITITAKNISISYKGYKINIIDTPGHADFGGEVERTLNMADGCILLVDAQEGPMPQTKFVLKKALELNLRPIVLINKIDKKYASPEKVIDKVNDLFLSLASNTDQLEFPIYYAIGREGKVFAELPQGDLTIPNSIPGNVAPLLDAIIEYVPSPVGNDDEPFQMQITSLEYDAHLGRYLIGKVARGTVKTDDSMVVVKPNVSIDKDVEFDPKNNHVIARGKVRKVFVRDGLIFTEVLEAKAGEIIAIAGIDTSSISATVCSSSVPEAIPVIKISSPSLKIKFEANTSPLVGKDGKFVTPKLLQQRLEREIETNISLQITKSEEGYYVAGRGELQLSILIETMRREGYEFQVRKPEVVLLEENGVKMEPIEELVIDVPQEYSNSVAAGLVTRKAEMLNMEIENDQVRYTYKILTRNMLGLRNELLTATKGNVIINNFLLGYVPFTQQPEPFRRGALIASESGVSAAYAINTIQYRGQMFINPADEVYEGMIIGVNKYETDLEVNPCKARHKSGVRVNQSSITHIVLDPVLDLSLDFALVFLGSDEILEVTPKNLRLRKQFLSRNDRNIAMRDKKFAQK